MADSPIEAALADIDKSAAELRMTRQVITSNRSTLNKLLHKLSGADSFYITAGRHYVVVYAYVTGIDGFNAPRLQRLLEPFATDDWSASTSDDAANLKRTYRFQTHSEGGPSFVINVEATAKSDSPTCRKVVVGKRRRVTTEKVYTIQCQ